MLYGDLAENSNTYLFRADSTVLVSALLNFLENSLGRSKPATRLMQAQQHTVWKFLLYPSLTELPSIEIK